MHYDDDGEMEANMDGLCPVCGREGCEDHGPDTRGTCPTCGEWGCEKHAAALGGKLLEGVDPSHIAAAKDLAFRMYKPTFEELELISEGKEMIFELGLEQKFKKLSPEEQEALAEAFKGLDEEFDGFDGEEEKEEETEDGKDWVLPPPVTIAMPFRRKEHRTPKIGVAGGTVLYSDYPPDEKTGGRYKPTSWLTLLKQEHTCNSYGQPKIVSVLRPSANPERYNSVAMAADEIIPHLRRHLLLALEAEARVTRDRSMRHGKIDAGRASRLVTDGRSDVFFKKSEAKSIKTAVQIVLDDSGSMQHSGGKSRGLRLAGKDAFGSGLLETKNGVSMLLAICLGEVCNQLGIPFEILSYHSNSEFSPGEEDHYSILYKTFNEPWAGTKHRLGNYRCGAGTDLPYEAANFAVNRLCARTEPHRIMFFLSDGQDLNRDVNKLADLAEEADEKAKIKIVGISIIEDGIKKHMGHRAEQVDSLDDLTETVFLKLAKLIHPT